MDQEARSTREKIMAYAGDIFGKKGFKGTTIRMIAEAAGVNVAAVNYHFQNKEGLYAEVLSDIFARGFERFPSLVPETDQTTTPEGKLRQFIRGTLYRVLSAEGWGGLNGKGRLIAREMMDPTPAFTHLIETYIRPHKNSLVVILKQITGSDTSDEDIILCVVSILGQCIYYVFATAIIERMAPEYTPVERHIDRIVDHVYRFSLAGLKPYTQTKDTP
jgi:AcrR family transcriptional regulator